VAIAPPELLLGDQRPTHRLVPDYDFSLGPAFVELGEMVGVRCDPWQVDLLTDGLGIVTAGDAAGAAMQKFAAYEVFVELSRQNGKSAVFELRCIGGLYLLRERRVVYSAHRGETVQEAFDRIVELIHTSPELLAEVRRFNRTNGKEGIELWSGQKLKFRTRTANGGRGLVGDCVILDESQDLVDSELAAGMPIISARPNAQLWYGGSAGTKRSTVQGRLIRRMSRGTARLCGYRWAAEEMDPDDPRTWARVNPALGRRQAIGTFESEHDAMAPDDFAHERLGVGDYPREEGEDWVIPRSAWERAEDPDSKIVGPVVFGLSVKWDRTRASIGVAGRRRDGRIHVELIRNDAGTMWTPGEVARLMGVHENLGVVIDPSSPAANLVGPLKDLGIEAKLLKQGDLARAFGDFYDGLVARPDDPSAPPMIVHTGGSWLTASMAEAEVRTATGALAWRQAMSADTSPTHAVTNAAYKLVELEKPKPTPAAPRRATSTTTRGRRDNIRATGF
jgi:hypothetical protein